MTFSFIFIETKRKKKRKLGREKLKVYGAHMENMNVVIFVHVT